MPKRPYAAFNPRPLFAAAKRYGHTTHRAIAQHAGIDETALSRFASGDRAPQFETLVMLIDAYDLDFKDVVGYKTRRRLRPPTAPVVVGDTPQSAPIEDAA